jgi:hypothetical protein
MQQPMPRNTPSPITTGCGSHFWIGEVVIRVADEDAVGSKDVIANCDQSASGDEEVFAELTTFADDQLRRVSVAVRLFVHRKHSARADVRAGADRNRVCSMDVRGRNDCRPGAEIREAAWANSQSHLDRPPESSEDAACKAQIVTACHLSNLAHRL